jgi:hypothetical protein
MSRSFWFYAARKGAITEARPDQVAGTDLRGGTNENPIGVLNQGIATMQNFERRKGMKARVCCVEIRSKNANKTFERAVKSSTA